MCKSKAIMNSILVYIALGLLFVCVMSCSALPDIYTPIYQKGEVVIFEDQEYEVVKFDSYFNEYKLRRVNCKGTTCVIYILSNQLINNQILLSHGKE